MADIFGRVDQEFNGGLSADSLFMVWENLEQDGLGLLIQGVSLQYTQPVRRIFELGPGIPSADGGQAQAVYYIVGRPEGTMQLSRIFGIASISVEFYETYGDPCNLTPDIKIFGQGGCVGNIQESQQWTIGGVIINGVAMNATAQEMVIQESITMMFSSLNIFVF